MAVHRCREVESTTNRLTVSVGLWSFWERSGDLKHHKYRDPQSDEVQCPTCQHWFKNTRGQPKRKTPGVASLFLPVWMGGDVTHIGSLQQDRTGVCVCVGKGGGERAIV